MRHNKTIFSLALLTIAFLSCITILFSSCIRILNPLVTSKNTVRYDAVIGKWHTQDYDITIERYFGSDLEKSLENIIGSEGESESERIKKMPDDYKKIYLNSYLVRFKKNRILHLMGLKFTTINNEIYAQLESAFAVKVPGETISPTDSLQEEVELFPNAEPSYTIAKARVDNHTLKLQFINTDFIETLLHNGAIAIKYEEDNLFDTQVITASSEELAKFLSKYGKDDRLYSAENTILLQRKLQY